MRFYVHGAGRAGRDAWPGQSSDGAVFADHSGASSMRQKADLVGAQCPVGRVVVIAHSLGAVPAAMAYDTGVLEVSHVVLVEPALYDVARGDVAVEGHIGPMTQARERAARGDLFGYWQVVAPMMFGREATAATWQDDRELAERFAGIPVPWGHGVEATVFASVPSLVVTGGWNDEYEAIADRLSRAGAAHVRLPGARHRPQDRPGFEPAVADFLRG